MAEYNLSYSAEDINEKLGMVDELSTKIKSGRTTVSSIGASSTATASVTFDTPFSSNSYTVVANAQNTSWVLCAVNATKETNGFSLTLRNLNTSAASSITVNWIAILD